LVTVGTWLLLLSVCTPFVPSVARAQADLIEEGVRDYESGELARADESLRAALQAGSLSRAEVVRILTHQVLVARALEDDAALDAAAVRLMSLAPDALRDQAPPDLAAKLDAIRERSDGSIRVEVIHEVSDDGVHVQARVAGDAGGLVREIALRARTRGSPWPVEAGTAIFLEGARVEDVEVAARVLGPGGSVLATRGTESAPAALESAPAEALAPDPVGEAADDGGNGVLIGVLVGLAVALVAGGIVLGVVLATSDQGDSRVGSFGVSW
jgi:hypothetical protein